MKNIFIGSKGIALDFIANDNGIAIDLSMATLKELILKNPNGISTKKALTVIDAPTGKLRYVLVAGDISIVGTWQMHLHLVYPTSEFYSEIQKVAAWPHL